MKFLCLIYDDERTLAAMAKPEMDAFMGEYMAFTDSIAGAGKLLGGEELQPVHTATTLRIRDGAMTTTPGPFAGWCCCQGMQLEGFRWNRLRRRGKVRYLHA